MNRSTPLYAGLFVAVMFLIAPAAAITWTGETVDSSGEVGEYTSLALNSSDYPCISYRDVTNHDLKYSAWNGSSWNLQTVDSAGDVGGYASLALDSTGYPRISYRDDWPNDDLKYAAWNGTAWNLTTVDTTGNVGTFTSLALGTSGNPRISYYDTTNGDLKYATLGDLGWSISTVDSTNNVGSYSSLALDGSGNPRISYYDTTNGDLKYAAWNGTAWIISTVDSTGTVGSYTSLALDSSGNPRISYYDTTNGDLKYAALSGTAWSTQTLDSNGNVGKYTSLAIDHTGNAHISYSGTTTGELKYAAWNGAGWVFQTVAGNGGLYTSLEPDTNDSPGISYYDNVNKDLKYTKGAAVVAGFTAAPTSGSPSLAVSFSDTSTGTPTAWMWFFGDGGISTDRNPVHTYTTAGTYSVYLTAKDTISGNTTVRVAVITVTDPGLPAVTADFTASPRSGTAPLVVTFTDASLNSPASWNWNFGSWSADDDGTSSLQSPSHTYSSPGNYTVSLTANNTAGSDTLTRAGYISVTGPGLIPITADFSADPPLDGDAPLTVTFHDSSSGLPDSWSWSFGDGSISATRNPAHTYTTAGAYTVTLTAANSSVTDTKSVPGYVTVTSVTTPVVANFASTPRNGTVPLTVAFTDASAGLPNVWSWSFGDGGVSTEHNPSHTYTSTGSYAVSLTAVNGTNTNTLTQAGYISVVPVPVTAIPTIVPSGTTPAYDYGSGSDSEPASLASPLPGKTTDLYFKVHSDYLSEHKVMPADILIMSYGNRGWEALPTAFVRSSGNDFYFTADADQYSLLAIGNSKEGSRGLPAFATARVSSAPSPLATLVSPADVPDTPAPGSGQGIVSGPVTVSTTPVPPVPADPATGFPFTTAALIGVGGVGLIGGGMVVRRWWIRRQNPALFREYD